MRAPYIEWMREHREIFEVVDGVGHYNSGCWLSQVHLTGLSHPVSDISTDSLDVLQAKDATMHDYIP